MSFIFSDIHNWQNDKAVAQILVFPDQETKQMFDKAFAERIKVDGIENASDAGIGATYRLRAVKDSNNKYVPVIRAGAHGGLLWEGEPVGNKDTALKDTMQQLYYQLLKQPRIGEKGVPVHYDKGVHFYLVSLVDENFLSIKSTTSGNYEPEKQPVEM